MQIFVWIFLFIILVIGIGFSAMNAGMVTINYLAGMISVPLVVVILFAFVFGVLFAGLLLSVRMMRLQHQVKVMRINIAKVDATVSEFNEIVKDP